MRTCSHRLSPLTASLVLLFATVTALPADPPPGPEGLTGFSGQVRGVVVKKREENGVDFKVGRVLKTWKNNQAEQPEKLVGRTVPVGPSWVQGDNGKWHPVENHVRFLRTLEPGTELTLEIKHAEREHFAILELSKEQRERGGRGEQEGREKQDPRDAEIADLRRELERLKAEKRELLEKLEKSKER